MFWSDIKKLKASRASIEDRIRLLDQWMNAASGLDTEYLLEYQVRRRENGQFVNEVLQPYDELLPGDLLVVVVKSPDTLETEG
jgi:exopolysaccharide production protein ExoF